MKHPLFLTYLLTRGYTAHYRYLDRQADVCFARMTTPRTVESDGEGESWNQRCIVTLRPEDLTNAKAAYRAVIKDPKHPKVSFRRFMQQAISDYFAEGCGCEHDCCGHVFGWGSAKQIGPRTFNVKIFRGINV